MFNPKLTHWTIRKKLLVSMVLLGLVIAVLGYSSFRGAYAYRDLATTLSIRASEMPITADLTRAVDELRNEYPWNDYRSMSISEPMTFRFRNDEVAWREEEEKRFLQRLDNVKGILDRYHIRLQAIDGDDSFLADRTEELELAGKMAELLSKITRDQNNPLRDRPRYHAIQLHQDLNQLSNYAHDLPMLLTKRMASFREEVRDRYRTWIGLSWGSAILAAGLLFGLIAYARLVVIRPFKELLAGARRVAAGDFTVRVGSDSKDELAELADAINMGVASFLNIQQDLHEQVRERSQEVIRNEQLASVGFLAAGVAHEINNPLASIAWSAEALESRIHKILPAGANFDDPQTMASGSDLETLRTYLRRIQDEAFRCKGITERLLDFSRLGNEERRQYVDIVEVIEDVVDLVKHLGQFRSRKILFNPGPTARMAWASPQEMKQVVLNLLTNALESLDPRQSDGQVIITIDQTADHVLFAVEDNGSGMTEDVLQHLFEPFFTRRRDGRGTGLGLPITSRIIADHGGHISAKSLGLGVGSRFEVVIPSQPSEQNTQKDHRSNSFTVEPRYAA